MNLFPKNSCPLPVFIGKTVSRRNFLKGNWRQIAALLASFLIVIPLFGQQKQPSPAKSGSTSIQGTVNTKQDGAFSGVAGVTLKLATNAPGDNPVTANTDDTGHYEFKALKPGTYTLSITPSGFKAATKQVTVVAGQITTQDFQLELEVVTEKIEVQGENQNIATETVSTPTTTVGQRELISLPTPQEKIREVLPITPGVVRTQDGKLTFKGADENQSLLLVNSARTGDPVTGSFSIPVPTDAVQSFAVYKTPYNAGLGSFSGAVTTVETKPPEDVWNFNVKSFIPSVLGKEGHMVGLAEAMPGVTFGGPLIAKKFFFSEVFQYDMKKRTIRGLPWPDDISKKQGFNSFTTLEALLSKNHVLTMTVNAFPLRQQHYDANSLAPLTTSNDLNQKGIAVGLDDRYQFDSGASFTTVAQYVRFDSNAHGQGFDDMLITPEGWGGNYFNQWSRRGKEFQVLPSYQFAQKKWLGQHEIHVGLDVNYRSFVGTSAGDPLRLLRQDGTLAGLTDFLGVPLQNVSDTSVAEFVQDHWVFDPHWSLDLGARLSSETMGWSAAFAPRVGIAYAPGNSGKTVIRSGIGLFNSTLPLLAGDFSANPTRVVSLYDTTGTLIGPPVTYTNAYVGSFNPLTSATLPKQPDTSPRNLTWNVEVEHELPKSVRLRVGYIESHTTYLFTINPFQSTTLGNSFLGLTNTGSSRYREFETTLRFKIRQHDEVSASYIWSRSRGDLNNLSNVMIPFVQPVIRPNVYGILRSDVPQRVVTWGIFSMPWKTTFSPIVDVHTGQAYSNIDVLQNYVGTPNGQRFDTYFSLDVKFYREFRIPFFGSKNGRGHRIRLGFYSLNVTNHRNFHDVYNNVTAPNFGQFAGFLDRRDGAIIDFID